MRRLSLIFAALVAAACGTKGPLTLPPKTATAAAPKAPAQPAPASTPAGQTAPADNSSKPATGAAQ